MRGGFLHNDILLQPVAEYFRRLGAEVHEEYAVQPGRSTGYADLFILYGNQRIICEAELSAARIQNDYKKAAVLETTLLLIVVPNRTVLDSILRVTRSWKLDDSLQVPQVLILPLGQMLQRLTVLFPLMSCSNADMYKKTSVSRSET